MESVGDTKTDVMTTYMEGTPFEVANNAPFSDRQVPA